jgi:deazaflavin-dependent oxidoreductase (nitroreductase family)
MKGATQNALRLFTRARRPLALRSAGREGTATSVVRYVGRQSGRTYQAPVVVARHDDSFLIALPYGERTDWLRNVLAAGSATITADGRSYDVDRPEVIPMAEATAYFRPREQRMHRQFHVDTALEVRERREDPMETKRTDPTARCAVGGGPRLLPALKGDQPETATATARA